jgi:hypothetical protein
MTDTLTRALDERTRLTRNFHRAKKSQYEAAFAAEPKLQAFSREIRRCGIGDAHLIISLVRAHHGAWLRNTSPDTRALALEIVSTRIRQIREGAGLPPFDDPVMDEEPDVYMIVRGILG